MHRIITRKFKKIRKIRELLKDVYRAKSNHLDGILKFKLTENLIPSNIERAEIKISSPLSEEIIIVPRSGLTFLTGDNLPFRVIDNNDVVEDRYIILPWKLDTETSRLELKNLIKKIPKRIRGMICTISYSLYVNENQVQPQTTATTTNSPIAAVTQAVIPDTQVITESMQDFSWSGSSFSEDNQDRLLDEMERLRLELNTERENYQNQLNSKNQQINTLETKVTGLETQVRSLDTQITQKQNEISNLNSQLTQKGKDLTAELKKAKDEAWNYKFKFGQAEASLCHIRSSAICYLSVTTDSSKTYNLHFFSGRLTVPNEPHNRYYEANKAIEEYNRYTVV